MCPMDGSKRALVMEKCDKQMTRGFSRATYVILVVSEVSMIPLRVCWYAEYERDAKTLTLNPKPLTLNLSGDRRKQCRGIGFRLSLHRIHSSRRQVFKTGKPILDCRCAIGGRKRNIARKFMRVQTAGII